MDHAPALGGCQWRRERWAFMSDDARAAVIAKTGNDPVCLTCAAMAERSSASNVLARAQAIVDQIKKNVDLYMDGDIDYETFHARQRPAWDRATTDRRFHLIVSALLRGDGEDARMLAGAA